MPAAHTFTHNLQAASGDAMVNSQDDTSPFYTHAPQLLFCFVREASFSDTSEKTLDHGTRQMLINPFIAQSGLLVKQKNDKALRRRGTFRAKPV